MRFIAYGTIITALLIQSAWLKRKGKSCEVKDCKRSFPNGASFVDFYSCNTCRCRNGKVKCTKMFCPQDPCMIDDVCYTFGELMHNGEMCSIMSLQKQTVNSDTNPAETGRDSQPDMNTDSRAPPNVQDYPQPHKNCELLDCRRSFMHGESFRDFYSCNMCKCEEGKVLCTTRKCPRAPCMQKKICYSHTEVMANGDVCQIEISDEIRKQGCEIKECGRFFNEGEVFKDFFSCNQCLCHHGRILCSKVMCPQEPCLFHDICYNDGEQSSDGLICNVKEREKNHHRATDCQVQECQRTFKDGASFHDFYSCNTCHCRAGVVTCDDQKPKCPQEPCMQDNACYSDGEKMPNEEICNTQTKNRIIKFWDLPAV